MVAKDVTITLEVDVEGICGLSGPLEEDVLKYCSLSDDNSGSGTDPKDFMSDVFGRKKVEWKAESKGRGTVKLLMVTINRQNPVIFKEGYILMAKGKKITGTILGNRLLNKANSEYTIYFEVINNTGISCGMHRIDPKLQANTILG